jgi:hypothetical protein
MAPHGSAIWTKSGDVLGFFKYAPNGGYYPLSLKIFHHICPLIACSKQSCGTETLMIRRAMIAAGNRTHREIPEAHHADLVELQNLYYARPAPPVERLDEKSAEVAIAVNASEVGRSRGDVSKARPLATPYDLNDHTDYEHK